MMKNKKLLLALLAACCTLSVGAVAGCSGNEPTSGSAPTSTVDSTPTSTVDSTSSSSSVEETQTFTVTFNSDGGSVVQAQTVEVGEKATKPVDPIKDDDADYTYAFAGWYNGETAWNFDTDTVTANVTLTAKWTATEKAVTFTVKFETNGGTAVADAKVKEGTDLTNVDTTYATTKSDLTFAGWYYTADFQNGTRVGVDMTTMPSALSGGATELTVYARWIVAFTVSFDSNGGSAVSSAVVEENTLATKPADPTKDLGDATKVAIFDGWYNGETAWNFETDTVTADVTLTAKWTEKALPKFIDSPMVVSGITGDGEVSVNTDPTYIAAGDETSIKVTLTNNNDVNEDRNVYYTALVPATEPSYGYYEMQIYASTGGASFVGDQTIILVAGWNTVQLTYAGLTTEPRIYIPLNHNSTMDLYLGSVKAYDNVSLPAFIDGELDNTKLKTDDPISINSDSAYIANGDESSVKVTFVNGHPTNARDCNIDYSALLPATEPSYDYYVWEIYSSTGAPALVGDKSVSLTEGWNTVQLTYTELTGHSRIYIYLNGGLTLDVYLGSLKGCYNLPAFIDGELDNTKLKTDDPISINKESAYIANGDESSVKVTFVNGHPENARDCNIDYSALIPATEPSYDYYVWEIYSSIGAPALVGDKSVSLTAGWNTVQLTYTELTGHARIYIYLNGGLTLDVYLGSLIGVDAPDAPAFIDGELDYTQLTTDNGTISLNTNDAYIANGDESSVKVTFTNNTPGAQDCKVYWTALIPATEPSYDYYVWKIYSSMETVALVGNKSVTLAAGWNEVQLSYDELTTKTRIYVPVNGNTTIDLYLGSLTGGVNADA